MNFNNKQKAFFIDFKGLSVVRNCPRPESGPLNQIDVILNTPETQLKSTCTEKM